ncbi:MAG: DUF4956 domain-containing protein [Oscillospiraceae bacterium]|nr:DUF4956 domain-containing protein [Oscillospiraceae bacterium]
MLNNIFKGIFNSDTASVISISDFLACVVSALIIGLILALCYMYKTRYSRSFVATIALLPAVVCVVIMMVNGNIGTAVAVAGAFSLVRFRSAAGTAKEILAIFLAMGTGLVVGMGYIGFGFLCAVIFGAVSMLYSTLDFGVKKRGEKYKTLHITIPEDLDYTGVFDDLLKEYTSEHELTHVKTTNMGSLYRLTYDIVLRDPSKEKEFIDQLRCRNGNLEISVNKQENQVAEL